MSGYIPTEEDFYDAYRFHADDDMTREGQGRRNAEARIGVVAIKADAWEEGLRASRAYDRKIVRWARGKWFAKPEDPRNPYMEDS